MLRCYGLHQSLVSGQAGHLALAEVLLHSLIG